MGFWEALGLGVLQGATEFLPVSSSGHLVMGQALLDLQIPGVRFEVALHVATLVSVCVVYRERILGLLRGITLDRNPDDFRYCLLILIATLPAGVCGVLFGDLFTALFEKPSVVGWALLVTGAFLFSSRWALKKASRPVFGARAALIIGFAQVLALVPGISRSGATVTAALWLGVAPVEAAAFSFLMSIPAIAGAGIVQLPELEHNLDGLSGSAMIAGSAAAFLSGIVAIRLFLALLRNRAFPSLAWYCWVAGASFLLWIGLT